MLAFPTVTIFVGLGLRYSSAERIGYETLSEKWPKIRELAALNGVSDRIDLRGECTSETLIETVQGFARPLIVVDVEGAEVEFFSSSTAEMYIHADLVIECHDGKAMDATNKVSKILGRTHLLKIKPEGSRDPNVIENLRGLCQFDRWILVWEGRGSLCQWIGAESRRKTQTYILLDEHEEKRSSQGAA